MEKVLHRLEEERGRQEKVVVETAEVFLLSEKVLDESDEDGRRLKKVGSKAAKALFILNAKKVVRPGCRLQGVGDHRDAASGGRRQRNALDSSSHDTSGLCKCRRPGVGEDAATASQGYTKRAAMWFFADAPWQYRVLDSLPPGIDRAQLERARAMTPAERIDAATELMELAEAMQRGLEAARSRR